MTKHEIKRAARFHNIEAKRKRMIFTRLLIFTLILFTAPAVAVAIDDPEQTGAAIVMTGTSTVVANLAIIGNIEDTSDRDAAGKQIACRVWLIALEQVDQDVSFPTPNANREVGTIPLRAGEVMHYFEAHDIPTDDSKGEKGDFTTETTNTFVIAMSGNRAKLLDFIEEHTGGKFIVIYQVGEEGGMFIMGNTYRPLILKSFERANNKEKRGVTFTFENSSFRQPYIYSGAIIKAQPVTLTAGTNTLAIIPGNDMYIIPNGTSAATPITQISGLSVNDKGRNITIKGLGTDKAATIEDGASFILEGGATWTGKTGSAITLRVLDPNRMVEVSGSRIQTV